MTTTQVLESMIEDGLYTIKELYDNIQIFNPDIQKLIREKYLTQSK